MINQLLLLFVLLIGSNNEQSFVSVGDVSNDACLHNEITQSAEIDIDKDSDESFFLDPNPKQTFANVVVAILYHLHCCLSRSTYSHIRAPPYSFN